MHTIQISLLVAASLTVCTLVAAAPDTRGYLKLDGNVAILADNKSNYNSKPSKAAKSDKTAVAQDYLKRARERRGQFEDAESIPLYEKALELTPDNDEARMELALQYAAEKRTDKCIAEYKKLMHSPNQKIATVAVTDLGRLYRRMRRYKDAVQVYESARKGPKDLSNIVNISDCVRLDGDGATALKLSEQIARINPFAGSLHRAKALIVLKRPLDALKEYNYVIARQAEVVAKLDPDRRLNDAESKLLAALYTDRADLYAVLKKPELAQQDRARAKKLNTALYEMTPFQMKE